MTIATDQKASADGSQLFLFSGIVIYFRISAGKQVDWKYIEERRKKE